MKKEKTVIRTELDNYFRLVARVDAHIEAVRHRFHHEITCKKGCDACCRRLTLFPVEAFHVAESFGQLLQKDRRAVLDRIDPSSGDCPLLIGHECRLYHARPLICRTHGYPIAYRTDNRVMVDYCPENFKGISTVEKEMLLDIDQLNSVLAAVNRNFLTLIETDLPLPERIDIHDALMLLEV